MKTTSASVPVFLCQGGWSRLISVEVLEVVLLYFGKCDEVICKWMPFFCFKEYTTAVLYLI